MSAYNKNDMMMLQEAYNIRLLREQAPHMTLKQLESKMQLMSESELTYVNAAVEGILNEFWGGLKNIGSSIGGGLKSAGKAASSSFSGATRNLGGKIADAGRNALDVGKGAFNAGKEGAKQIGSNVGDIYNKGQIEKRQSVALKNGINAIEKLRGYIKQAEQDGVLSGGQNFEDMTIDELLFYLQSNSEVSANNAKSASNRGITHGVGSKMKQGFKKP